MPGKFRQVRQLQTANTGHEVDDGIAQRPVPPQTIKNKKFYQSLDVVMDSWQPLQWLGWLRLQLKGHLVGRQMQRGPQ
jgi:hypothetical protein